MPLFSIVVGNRLSFFLVVAVLALLLCDNVALADPVVYDQGTEVVIESTLNDEGVEIIPSPAPDSMPTTGLLFDDTTVINNNDFSNFVFGSGILVRFGSKLIAYGGDVSSTASYALLVDDPGSSAAICHGTFTGGTISDPPVGASAVYVEAIADNPFAIEIKTGTFTGGDGPAGSASGGAGLTIDGSGSTGITLDGIFQGGDGEFAGCGLRVIFGANMISHGGQFLTGSGLSMRPCSLKPPKVAPSRCIEAPLSTAIGALLMAERSLFMDPTSTVNLLSRFTFLTASSSTSLPFFSIISRFIRGQVVLIFLGGIFCDLCRRELSRIGDSQAPKRQGHFGAIVEIICRY